MPSPGRLLFDTGYYFLCFVILAFQQAGQRDHSSVPLKEDTGTMETSSSDLSTKDTAGAEKEDARAATESPSLEEDAEDHVSEPPSHDLGFKKFFKFVGFRFTVKKEKTGKSEPVQLLTVKKETQVPEGAADQKEGSSEETAMPEDGLSAADPTKDPVNNEKTEDEPPKRPEAHEICSQSAALATDTASPLRKFFTQGWTGFRKKKSFRKPKEEELQSPTKEEEQEKEGATFATETGEREEQSELEKQEGERNVTTVTIEAYEKEQSEGEKQESKKAVAAMGVEASEKEELIKHDEQGEEEDVAAAVVKGSAKEKKAEEGDRERELVDVSEDLGKKEEKSEGEKASEVTEKPLSPRSVALVVGVKTLSGKKHKGKREESKLGGPGDPIQHLPGSPDSPEEQKGESSASSPEETIEIPSLEQPVDGVQVSENEDAAFSDVERKRDSVKPWALFKKMVTPKKRARRASESAKTKSVAVSATENAVVDENRGEMKENGMEQKPEKATAVPKGKVDSSVPWRAFLCIGSSKKRARKAAAAAASDEDIGRELGQESPNVEEPGQSKETATDAILSSSPESNEGQGNSSPEQAGSPSKGESLSMWKSFKRLVTPRRRSQTRMEERNGDSGVGSSLEHSSSDDEPGEGDLCIPFWKRLPGRRKKKSDGKPEPTAPKEAREGLAETTEEDSDIPAVVPFSEYEAAEQEKMEAPQAEAAEAMRERASEQQGAEKLEEIQGTEQGQEGLVHAVPVTVVEGERAVTSIEEMSPSWISAALTECIEQAEEEAEKETEKTLESDDTVEEAESAAKAMPEARKEVSDDSTASELELTSEAVTALEETAEASCAEEPVEVSLAEETTEMVSAVSQLLETPDTTEEVTPVQEVEATEQNLKELDKQMQKVLHEVAERVKSAEVEELVSERTMSATLFARVQGIESEVKDDAKDGSVVGQESVLLEQCLEKGAHQEDGLQPQGGAGSIQSEIGAEESVLQEGSGRSDLPAAMKGSTEGCENVEVLRDERQWPAREEAAVEDHEESCEGQRTAEEPSSQARDFHSTQAVTPKEEPSAKQEPAEEEKLPATELTADETREECVPEAETAVQDKRGDETTSLGLTAEEPVQLEGEGKTLPVGPEGTEAVVTGVPVQSERQGEIPDFDEQACTKGVPSSTPAQREEEEDDAVLVGVKSTEAPVTEVPLQNEEEASALPSERVGSEAAADAEQSVRDGAGRHIPAKDSVSILEAQCRAKPTETASQRDESEGGKTEGGLLEAGTHLESDPAVTEPPAETGVETVSSLASACSDITGNGSTVLTDISGTTCDAGNNFFEQETVEKEQELVESSNCQGFQKDENKNEQSTDRAKEAFESGKREAMRGEERSTAVQQEVLAVQEEGSDSAFQQAESLEALQVPVPVAAAGIEEHVMAETVMPADTPVETVEPLATPPGQMASGEVLVTTVACSGCGTAELGSAEAPEPQVTPASVNGISEGQERPQSTGQPEENGIPPSDSLSLTYTEFEKDVVQSLTIESQSTKIVLSAIQTAVHKLAETEESAALESEQRLESIEKSPSDTNIAELLGSAQVDLQLPVKEEEVRSKEQELQQSGTVKTSTLAESAEIHAAVEKTKDVLLTSEILKDGPSQNSLTIVTSPEDVSRASARLQKSTLELSTSEDSTKDPLDIYPPKLRGKEVGPMMEIPDQHTGQQTRRESEEERDPPMEDGKTQTWEDDSCQEGSPQSRNSVAPEALNERQWWVGLTTAVDQNEQGDGEMERSPKSESPGMSVPNRSWSSLFSFTLKSNTGCLPLLEAAPPASSVTDCTGVIAPPGAALRGSIQRFFLTSERILQIFKAEQRGVKQSSLSLSTVSRSLPPELWAIPTTSLEAFSNPMYWVTKSDLVFLRATRLPSYPSLWQHEKVKRLAQSSQGKQDGKQRVRASWGLQIPLCTDEWETEEERTCSGSLCSLGLGKRAWGQGPAVPWDPYPGMVVTQSDLSKASSRQLLPYRKAYTMVPPSVELMLRQLKTCKCGTDTRAKGHRYRTSISRFSEPCLIAFLDSPRKEARSCPTPCHAAKPCPRLGSPRQPRLSAGQAHAAPQAPAPGDTSLPSHGLAHGQRRESRPRGDGANGRPPPAATSQQHNNSSRVVPETPGCRGPDPPDPRRRRQPPSVPASRECRCPPPSPLPEPKGCQAPAGSDPFPSRPASAAAGRQALPRRAGGPPRFAGFAPSQGAREGPAPAGTGGSRRRSNASTEAVAGVAVRGCPTACARPPPGLHLGG
ncbi:uncharacterized protein RG961_015739 [Leptosomus discolor]